MRLKAFLVSSLAAPALFAAAPALAAQSDTAQPTPPVVSVPVPSTPPVTPERPLAPGGQQLQGSIQVCEAARGEHRIQLEAGRRYTISASSEGFDTYLRLFAPGNTETPVAENDDSGGGLNSRIEYTPTTSGEYVARVSSFAANGTGNYTLRVEPAAPQPALLTRATRTERGSWRVYDGELTAGDPADNGRHYDDYELRLTAGQSAMIHLASTGTGETAMDTVLKVYRLDARGGEAIAENDDGGGGLNSFLYFAPEEAGTYVVRVTTFGEGTTGRYRLRISQ